MNETKTNYAGKEMTENVKVSAMINGDFCGYECKYLLEDIEFVNNDFCSLFWEKIEHSHDIYLYRLFHRCEKCKQTFKKERS